MLQTIEGSKFLWLGLAGVMGLVWGSFVNVVVYRLPRMMEFQWRQEARAILELPGEKAEPEHAPERFNLVFPGSSCPACRHKITAMENIPVLSYVFLGGKCSSCKASISCVYPLLELLCAIGAVCCAHVFGFGWQAVAAMALTWALVALAAIDMRHSILPDSITLPFLWLGLLLNAFALFVPLHDAVMGAIAGYLSLWTLYQAYRLMTGKEGMGFGDFKLVALFGAWMGWQKLPTLLLLGAATGLAFAVIRAAYRWHKDDARGSGLHDPMPFGPSLVAAGWSVFMLDIDLLPSAGLGW